MAIRRAYREGVPLFIFRAYEEPVILSGEKYEKEIGALPRTSYRVGLEETIAWMNKRA